MEKEAECRIWHRYMTHSYELLSSSNQTLQDAGLYSGQVLATCIHTAQSGYIIMDNVSRPLC